MLNLKNNDLLAKTVKPYLLIVATFSVLASLTSNVSASNASLEGKWKITVEDAEKHCGTTYEQRLDNSSVKKLGKYKDPYFGVDIDYKNLKKKTVGSLEGLIEDQLCDEDAIMYYRRPPRNIPVSSRICYLGANKVLDDYKIIYNYNGGAEYNAEMAADSVPICINYFTDKYFGPTFEKLRKEKK